MSEHNSGGSMDLDHASAVADRENDGVILHVKDECGEPAYTNERPVTITVAGSYSHRYQRAFEAQRRRIVRGRRGLSEDEMVDRMVQQALDLVVACVVAWDGFTDHGQPFPFTKTNAVKLFQAAPWILRQVEGAMEDHERFFKPVPAPSPSS